MLSYRRLSGFVLHVAMRVVCGFCLPRLKETECVWMKSDWTIKWRSYRGNRNETKKWKRWEWYRREELQKGKEEDDDFEVAFDENSLLLLVGISSRLLLGSTDLLLTLLDSRRDDEKRKKECTFRNWGSRLHKNLLKWTGNVKFTHVLTLLSELTSSTSLLLGKSSLIEMGKRRERQVSNSFKWKGSERDVLLSTTWEPGSLEWSINTSLLHLQIELWKLLSSFCLPFEQNVCPLRGHPDLQFSRISHALLKGTSSTIFPNSDPILNIPQSSQTLTLTRRCLGSNFIESFPS